MQQEGGAGARKEGGAVKAVRQKGCWMEAGAGMWIEGAGKWVGVWMREAGKWTEAGGDTKREMVGWFGSYRMYHEVAEAKSG